METEIQVEKQEVVKVSRGIKSGLKFIQGFGYYLDKYKDEIGNREKVKQEMLEDFPRKSESVEKWLDWYKGYFNMGKIKGYNEDKSLNVKWNQ